jgi:Family of unknown function (DUF5675)
MNQSPRVLINGVWQCYYPEPLGSPHSIPGIPFLEAETYRDVLTISPQLGYVCPEVLNVPGRTAIRWHIGNVPKDVLGCCVVGIALGRDFVGNSRTAFDALMAELQEPEIIPISRSGSHGNRCERARGRNLA